MRILIAVNGEACKVNTRVKPLSRIINISPWKHTINKAIVTAKKEITKIFLKIKT